MPFIIENGPAGAAARLIIAHGAGAGITSPILEALTALFVERGLAVTRFEFSYMTARRERNERRPPPRAESLMAEYRALIQEVSARSPRRQRLFIGGKSLGGRVASMIAEEAHSARQIAGLVCLGYPFHPPSKPDALRTAHLKTLTCPTLIVQGDRDPFGNRAEVEDMALPPRIDFCWLVDGDHDFAPRRASGHTRQGNLAEAADAVAAFVSRNLKAR